MPARRGFTPPAKEIHALRRPACRRWPVPNFSWLRLPAFGRPMARPWRATRALSAAIPSPPAATPQRPIMLLMFGQAPENPREKQGSGPPRSYPADMRAAVRGDWRRSADGTRDDASSDAFASAGSSPPCAGQHRSPPLKLAVNRHGPKRARRTEQPPSTTSLRTGTHHGQPDWRAS
jgi:hypothetical protein